jgi:hypothetical protein
MQVAYILNQLLNAHIGVNGELYVPYSLVSQYFRDYENSSITWNIEDFQKAAFQKCGADWKNTYDEGWFENALHCMIDDHDAKFGITWNTVDDYLDKYCKHSLNDNFLALEENFTKEV